MGQGLQRGVGGLRGVRGCQRVTEVVRVSKGVKGHQEGSKCHRVVRGA